MPLVRPVQVHAASPLTGDERARAERVAARLYDDLGRLHAKLPEHAMGGSRMSRYLGIARNTCQRLSMALADSESSLETLVKLPGVKGLEQFLDALKRKKFDDADIEVALSAVQAFDSLINDLAGSHTKLIDRLSTLDASDVDGERFAEHAREQLTLSAANVTGRLAEVMTSLYIFRADEDDPSVLHRVLAAGYIGNTVAPSGMPIVLGASREPQTELARETGPTCLDDSPMRGSTPRALLEPFTTKPLPTITTRASGDDVFQVVDPATVSEGQSLDIVTALRSVHTLYDEEKKSILTDVWALVNVPCRYKVFDILLHRDLERTHRPSADAIMFMPGPLAPPRDHWVHSYPSQPKLELLGRGTSRMETDAYPRQRELAEFLFERVGWNADEFVGFRVALPYPIWRAGYCMSFEYLPG